MENKNGKLQLRQVGKGFVVSQMEGIVGRILTQTFMDQNHRTYVKINGKIVPLTDEHSFLAIS